VKLTLKKETLAELSADDLGLVNGAAPSPTFTCPTFGDCVEKIVATIMTSLPLTTRDLTDKCV
jgi:hypothetical protein